MLYDLDLRHLILMFVVDRGYEVCTLRVLLFPISSVPRFLRHRRWIIDRRQKHKAVGCSRQSVYLWVFESVFLRSHLDTPLLSAVTLDCTRHYCSAREVTMSLSSTVIVRVTYLLSPDWMEVLQLNWSIIGTYDTWHWWQWEGQGHAEIAIDILWTR